MAYKIQDNPFRVPTTDGKTILEHFGGSTGNKEVSIAQMVAPSGWSEPFQNPQFDEFTLVIEGKKLIEVDNEKIELSIGQSIEIKKGSRVRYSNPFPEPCIYVSVCIPAFSPELQGREEA